MIRILLVDDNPAVRRYLRAILEQQETWRVSSEARTGAEALHNVLESQPDFIVLDYRMPDLNGVEVAKQISKLYPKSPFLWSRCTSRDSCPKQRGKRAFAEHVRSRISVP